jgi:transketolase
VAQGWLRYADDVLGVEGFGASAPGGEMLEKYGFTVENVCKRAKALLAQDRLKREIIPS